MSKIIELIKKHKELIAYGIFGVLTTVVDFLSYFLLANIFFVEENISNILSQVIAIIFAFVTNKIFVFGDKKNGLKNISVQFTKFFSMRLVSLIINSGLFYLMVDLLKINDMISKAIVSIIVVILNYIFSKIFIFKKD